MLLGGTIFVCFYAVLLGSVTLGLSSGATGLIMLLAEFAVDLPELIRVSPLIAELERPLWMVAHADVLTQPRVRAVWEWLDANLARTPPSLDSGPHPAHA